MVDQQIPPGWYDDGSGKQRWWTGRDWGISAADWEAQEAVADGTGGALVPVQTPAGEGRATTRRAEEQAANAQKAEARAEQKTLKAQERQSRRAEKVAAKEAAVIARAHAEWEEHMQAAQAYLQLAESAQPTSIAPIMLQKGEKFWIELPCVLIDDIAERHFVAGRQGLSIPIASIGGHAVRYNMGSTSGHLVTGKPKPTVVDTGHIAITTMRAIYHGKKTLEHRFDRLVSFEPANQIEFELSVTNRQKSTCIRLEPYAAIQFHEYMTIATADFRGVRADLVGEIRAAVGGLQGQEPHAT